MHNIQKFLVALAAMALAMVAIPGALLAQTANPYPTLPQNGGNPMMLALGLVGGLLALALAIVFIAGIFVSRRKSSSDAWPV